MSGGHVYLPIVCPAPADGSMVALTRGARVIHPGNNRQEAVVGGAALTVAIQAPTLRLPVRLAQRARVVAAGHHRHVGCLAGHVGLAVVVQPPALGCVVGLPQAAGVILAYGHGHEDLALRRRAVLGLAPADHGAVARTQPASLRGASSDLAELLPGRRRGHAERVPAPADRGLVILANPAGVPVPRRHGVEEHARGRRGLALLVAAPAVQRTVGHAKAACVPRPSC
mmetsp:Transcript_50829/g.131033  ORF Transcript_50829/g.131033 Transcript_50829/m.131033 type:complete len:227 (+) Transcript_50829:30-710(+)